MMLLTLPGTELVLMPTVAACAEPVYVTGELLTASVAVGVALAIEKASALEEAVR